MNATHKYMNNRIFLGKSGGWFYYRNGRKIYVSDKHLMFTKVIKKYEEPLFPFLPKEVENIIVDFKLQLEAQEKNWYKFLVSLTQHQREQFCLTVRMTTSQNVFKESISLALLFFPINSRIYKKAISQLRNY